MAQLIDGKQIASDIRQELKEEVVQLQKEGIRPGLMVIFVGDNPASQSYIRGKVRAATEVGIASEVLRMGEGITETQLLDKIEELNQDEAVHGILVQLPLPKHIDELKVIEAISPEKDVDGFTPINVGKMMTGLECYLPCTPFGIMQLLERSNVTIDGKHVVVIGRSNIVGKPVSMLLQRANATVTMCHSRTPDLATFTQQADIIVSAVGKVGLITADHIKDGAVVIDVAMNRNEEGKLVGDVVFDEVFNKASAITPVPGGVGPMTIAMLMRNTIEAAKRASEDRVSLISVE
ncbi:methylenetetrahydrofolate dehydrogenase (NADP+) / methenyltetrahydrofolate cyclohydrolase [Thermoactinomyces sp. DSM 45891]|uniref:bifunctional methylenetetrahydrofolate dehydrogenase/methenyltetrahydrofolate cyclohydrolase FolD n=1 Tax=Thermoactinomyces sp. DSM 45891 TaxID=1761907 RepID=UPI0009124DF8|nr:bifunctional methylenetetrahydrofolate dehydrogenase/methenyltetrahydrofolate cyclohydrolase FolD [Thermoactinomyces sp. DSM 45891]SFX52250.1 methylenetetrahydrofolate dehydrogenase (NADP+) / methenyltetrahydrofolate cyclohydrolase [Thermoactinomyces sp. DSM 45891]